jgi:hypothetical protein
MSVITIRSAAGIAVLAAVVAGGGYAVTTYADAAQAKPVKAAHAAARADVAVRRPRTPGHHAAPAVSPAPAPSKAPATPLPTPAPAMSPAQQGQNPAQQGQTSGQQWPTPAPPMTPAPQPTSSWSPMG